METANNSAQKNAKVFFSYASENRPLVDQVYRRVKAAFPDIEPWLDTYEIVGGDELIDKVAAGIESADKFFIFLSAQSIDKPWVKKELRAALMMKEIQGIKPQFIVPVKLGEIPTFPPFIESKRYIDLAVLTEKQWLAEIRGAILGISIGPSGEKQENLEALRSVTSDLPEGVAIVFSARYWAEEIGFKLTTNKKIIERHFRFLDRPVIPALSTIERSEDYLYAVGIPSEQTRPGDRFAMLLRFTEGTDPLSVVIEAERWDGEGGIAALKFFGPAS